MGKNHFITKTNENHSLKFLKIPEKYKKQGVKQ